MLSASGRWSVIPFSPRDRHCHAGHDGAGDPEELMIPQLRDQHALSDRSIT
jgi:hypothetical protein